MHHLFNILAPLQHLKCFAQACIYYVLVYTGFCILFLSACTCRHIGVKSWVVCGINYFEILTCARDLKFFTQIRVYNVLVYAGFCILFPSARTCRHILVNSLYQLFWDIEWCPGHEIFGTNPRILCAGIRGNLYYLSQCTHMQTHWSEIMVVCSINYSVTLSCARNLKSFAQTRV